MPRGLIRYHHSGNFHFITFSCFHRLPHLGTAAARDLFEDALERTRRRYRFFRLPTEYESREVSG
jgi:putative transposase